jgi:hypothetical protein
MASESKLASSNKTENMNARARRSFSHAEITAVRTFLRHDRNVNAFGYLGRRISAFLTVCKRFGPFFFFFLLRLCAPSSDELTTTCRSNRRRALSAHTRRARAYKQKAHAIHVADP